MKKAQIVLLSMLLVMSTLLFGCSNSKDNTNQPSNTNSSSDTNQDKSTEKVTLKWMNTADPERDPWVQDRLKTFNDSHDNIEVKVEYVPYDQFDQKLTTLISSGNAPDIFPSNAADNGFATYMNMGALLDMTELYNRDQSELLLDDKLVDIYKNSGKLYGIPYLALGTFLYYNKDLFDKAGVDYPPTDWDDKNWNFDKYQEDAIALTHDVGDLQKQVFGTMVPSAANLNAWSMGGDFFKPEAYQTGIMGEPDIVNDTNIAAIQYYADLINKHKVAPNPEASTALEQLGDPFLTGRVAMVISGGWSFGSYSNADFNWGVAAVPYHEGREVPIYVDPWNISAKTDHPEEAWEFVKFLVSEESVKAFVEITKMAPANPDLNGFYFEQIEKLTGIPVENIEQSHIGALKYGREADNHLIAKYSSILNTINQTSSSVWGGKESVEDGLKEIDKNLRSLKLE